MLGPEQTSIFDALLDAVVASDLEGRITYVNKAAEALLGWTNEELLGRPLITVMPERLHALHTAAFRRKIETRQGHIIGRPFCVPALRRDPRLT